MSIDQTKIKKGVFYILISGILILILIGLVRLGNVFGFLIVFPWFLNKLSEAGLNVWLGRVIAIPLVVFIIYSAGLLFSFKSEKRKKGYIFTAMIFVIWFLLLFFIQKDFAFDPMTGKPLKHYASTPYGYQEVSGKWKFHPVFGTPVIPGNSELAISKEVEKKGLPKLSKIVTTKDTVFFSPTGQPLVWYYQHPDGKIDLFPRAGIHPQFGVVLNPVNSAIVYAIFKQLDEEKRDTLALHETDDKGTKLYVPKLSGLKKLKDALKKSKIKTE